MTDKGCTEEGEDQKDMRATAAVFTEEHEMKLIQQGPKQTGGTVEHFLCRE